jgi:hypothetical protein
MLRQAFEIYLNDTTTMVVGDGYFHLAESVIELENFQKNLIPQYEEFIPPKDNHITDLYKAMRLGMCFYGNSTVCATMKYNPEYGYTKELSMSGIDMQLSAFIETCKKYLDDAVYTPSVDSFKLLDKLTSLIDVSIPIFQNLFVEYYGTVCQSMSTLLFMFSGLIIALIIVLQFTGFWPVCVQHMKNNKQLVAIFYGVPAAERVKIYEVNTFIESAGASI